MNAGDIVKIMLPDGSVYRVGVVVCEFDHTTRGGVVAVRTAHNIVSGQQFDPVASGSVVSATLDELLADVKKEKVQVSEQLDEWLAKVVQHEQ